MPGRRRATDPAVVADRALAVILLCGIALVMARFELVDDDTTRGHYPFAFRLTVAYALAPDALTMTVTAHNPARDAILPASIGFHPAFAWPLLPGAAEFLTALRAQTQVIILSDTFEQFAQPLLRQMGWPTIWCHRLVVENDRIAGYRLRLPDQKRRAVSALQSLNYRVIAAGDSYNDTTMLGQADHGFLFHAPENVVREFPRFPALNTYADLLARITACL